MKEQTPRFTKGEWFLTPTGDICVMEDDRRRKIGKVFECSCECRMDGLTEGQANSRLMAAAPDLFESETKNLNALKIALDMLRTRIDAKTSGEDVEEVREPAQISPAPVDSVTLSVAMECEALERRIAETEKTIKKALGKGW